MKVIALSLLVLAAASFARPCFADVEAYDDNVECNFTILGYTRASLFAMHDKPTDKLTIKAINHCTGATEALQLGIGGGGIMTYSGGSTIIVDGSFKKPGDKSWTTRNLKLKN